MSHSYRKSRGQTGHGCFEQAKSAVQLAMRLSPRDPSIGLSHANLGIAELRLGHFDAAIEEYHNAIVAGYRPPRMGFCGMRPLPGEAGGAFTPEQYAELCDINVLDVMLKFM